MTLAISKNLSLPIDTITDTIGILAIKGAGKSFTSMVVVEEMVRAGLPVVVIDPVGVFWGLRLDADGRGPGLDVVIVGGSHGDVPLEATAGRLLADIAIEERRPMVLDTSGFETKADQLRFVKDFAMRLYHANRDAMHVVIDEADDVAPQRPLGRDEPFTLRAIEVLVRRGRARGIGVTLITQRAAAINKGVLTQVSTLVLGRTISPQDRAAVRAWVEAHGTEEQIEALEESLASLPTREKWVWAPTRDVFKRVEIRPRLTFDSSATPKVGAKTFAPPPLKPIALDALKRRIAATVDKTKADDPKALRARIVDLERELARASAAPPAQPREVRVPFVPEKVLAAVKNALVHATDCTSELNEAIRTAVSTSILDTGNLTPPPAYLPVERRSPFDKAPYAPTTPVTASRVVARTSGVTPHAGGDSKLGKCERAILTVLAQYPQGRTKVQVAILAGYSHSSGGFRNALSTLRTAGLIDGGGDRLVITDAGVDALGAFEPLPTGRALLDYWKANAGGRCERLILEELAGVYPRALPKEAVASRTGYQATSGGFRNSLSRLRTLELIKGTRELRLVDTLAEAS